MNNAAWTEGPEYLKDPEERGNNEFSENMLAVSTLSPEELQFKNEEKKQKDVVSYCTTIQSVDKPMIDEIMHRHNEFQKVLRLLEPILDLNEG